jgi:DNA-binding Lrp family transcriptional regulator
LQNVSLHRDRDNHDTGGDTVLLVRLLSEIGPDIAEIARRLGQNKESVRYRYREKIVKAGFSIKANVDYGALGLTRVVMKLRMAAAYREKVHELFEAMSDLSYLAAYAGTMSNDLYIAHAGVPREFIGEFHRFMEDLKEKGVFSSVELFDCDWFSVAPMRGECFDFDEGIWDFDWSKPLSIDQTVAKATVSERKQLDKIDLLLVKELWRNGDRSLVDIRAAIKKTNGIDVNYKTLGWHYAHHVLGQRLIRGYSLAWHGLKYNFIREKTGPLAKHKYLGVSLIVRQTDEQENMELRSRLNRLPFIWSVAAGEAFYSQLYFPLDMTNEALDHLKTLLKPYSKRAEIYILDQNEMASFTIGYKLWDDVEGRWSFDRESALSRLEMSTLKISALNR